MPRSRPPDATLTASEGGVDGTAPTLVGATLAPAGDPLPREKRIGRFVVEERLGAGGMGEVYACRDPALDRRVAVKLLHPSATSTRAGEQLMQRLRREAQAAGRLSHRNVVTVHDVGLVEIDERGEVFVAMELIDGGTLDDWLAARPRGWKEIVAMFVQAGRGLAAAHSAGIVHRDFKPSNVLITRAGEAKVSDFGLATSGDGEVGAPVTDDGSDSLTRTGTVMGTPMFMAPEQRDGARVDARADLYAFCVALFRAIWGVHPFGNGFAAIAENARAHRIVEVPRRGPAALLRVVRAGLDPDPGRRPASMGELLDQLERLVRGRPRVVLAAAALAVVAAVLAAWWATRPAPAAACGGAQRELDAAWGPAQRAAIERGFAASGLDFAGDAAARVMGHLDRWGDRWVRAHTDVCRATRVDRSQSERVMDLRIACLQRQRADLATLAELLARGEADTIPRASQLALALPAPPACDDVAALEAAPPDDPALSARLVEAELRLASGRHDEAIAIASEVLAAAQTAGARALEARAGVVLGRAQSAAGDYRGARPTLFEAALDAQIARQPALAVQAWSATLSVLTGLNATREDEAQAYAQGQAALEMAGGRLPAAEAILLHDHANYLTRTLDASADAIPLLERALEIMRERVDPDSPLVASLLDTLGGARSDIGEPERGIELGREALAMRERLFGPEHPAVARSAHNLAVSLAAVGRLDEAEALFRKALALKTQTLGATHPMVSNTLIELAELLAADGRLDEAVETSRRDLALWLERSGPGSEEEAESRRALADLLVVAGRSDEALAEYRQTQTLYAAMETAELQAIAAGVGISMVRPLVETGQLGEAEAALAAAPDDTPLRRIATARVALARGRRDDARAALDALDRDGLRPWQATDAILLEAEVLRAAGDLEAARAKAREVRPRCEPIRCSHWTFDRVRRADAILN